MRNNLLNDIIYNRKFFIINFFKSQRMDNKGLLAQKN